MPTPTERRIIEERRAAKSGMILVPILEKLLEHEVIPQDEEDFQFLSMLVRARAMKRQAGVFSPSQLGTCTRQAYFGKRGEDKHLIESPRSNGYFLEGNFKHFKWQFAMWKAHRAGMLELVKVPSDFDLAWPESTLGDLWRWAVEVRVVDGDLGGTIDVIAKLPRKRYPIVIDFKGINQIDFQRTVKNGAALPYQRQIVGYSELVNKVLDLGIKEALLVCENKSGPMGNGNPLALHETSVPMDGYVGDVQRRLRTLRWYDSKDELPGIECVSTKHMQFQECPFNRFCREEVTDKQRELEARASKSRRDVKVSRSRR
jgi:hypothetical protein